MTKLYSIYLEVRNRQASIDAVCELFIGFTAFDSTGVWLKKQEPGLKIEIVTDEKFFGDIWLVAEELKRINQQDTVLITIGDVERAIFV